MWTTLELHPEAAGRATRLWRVDIEALFLEKPTQLGSRQLAVHIELEAVNEVAHRLQANQWLALFVSQSSIHDRRPRRQQRLVLPDQLQDVPSVRASVLPQSDRDLVADLGLPSPLDLLEDCLLEELSRLRVGGDVSLS